MIIKYFSLNFPTSDLWIEAKICCPIPIVNVDADDGRGAGIR